MRPLFIEEVAKAKAARVREYAENKDHWYRVGGPVPGDIPEHVCVIDTYRCVFSITEALLNGEKQLFRHFSVSVPDAGKLPNPVAVWALASLFGFSGWDKSVKLEPPAGWQVAVSTAGDCVIVAQIYAPEGE